MADIQFTIKESLAPHQAKLAIPVFTKGKSQLDPISVKKKRGIANVHTKHTTKWLHDERKIKLMSNGWFDD